MKRNHDAVPDVGPRLRHRRVRVYESLRTAHLERARELEPASLVFFGHNYDFDPELAEGLDLVPVSGTGELGRLLLHEDVRELEINEPLMLMAVKHSLVAVLAARVSGALRGRRVRIATYAIENARPLSAPSRRLRTPWRRWAYRAAVRVVLGQVDRIAFGTSAAMTVYRELVPRPRSRGQLVPAVSTACSCLEGELGARPPVLLFVGTFDERKGLRPVLEVWPEVAAAVPGARLVVVGQGELEERVRRLVEQRRDVELSVAPSREEIHARLRRARSLVLWSQPSPTWREQVGLPLVEGLSHGCHVVASDETGIADWLVAHGHDVVPVAGGADSLQGALVRSLRSERSPADVLADLPHEDGRLAADRWLWSD